MTDKIEKNESSELTTNRDQLVVVDNIEHQDKGELVANCDWFFFIYVVCHISIFIFEITNCDLKRIVVIMRTKVVLLAFKARLHNPFL